MIKAGSTVDLTIFTLKVKVIHPPTHPCTTPGDTLHLPEITGVFLFGIEVYPFAVYNRASFYYRQRNPPT